jgi:tRNA threonylcarbamoyladenosine biosynthesis protein TsaB
VPALASRAQGKVAAVLDGGRGEVYFGAYKIAGESIQVLQEQLLSKADFLSAAAESTIATPDLALAAVARDAGLSVVAVAPPNPEMIARFGWKKLQTGETVTPEQLEANYLRRSDAELFVKKSF